MSVWQPFANEINTEPYNGKHYRQSFPLGELIYTCKTVLLESRLGSNLAFFSGSVNLYIFPGSKPDNLLLNTARFSGYNLGYNLTFLSGSNLQVQTWINIQVSPDNPTFQA